MIGIDLKHYGHPRRRAADRALDNAATCVGFVVFLALAIGYLAGMIP